MHRLLPLGPLLLLGLLAGCATTEGSIGRRARSPDSLRAENARLQDQARALRDSLQRRRDLDTGQYYRELRTLQDHLNRLTYEVRLLRDGGMTVTILPVDSLFESGSAALRADGPDRLERLAHQLQTTYPDRTVRVEGHTDDVALGDSLQTRFPSNWELSTARATAVVRRLIDLTDLDRSQFVAVGYGATRPRASNDTATGRRRNRRVRVTVLPLPKDYARPFETTW